MLIEEEWELLTTTLLLFPPIPFLLSSLTVEEKGVRGRESHGIFFYLAFLFFLCFWECEGSVWLLFASFAAGATIEDEYASLVLCHRVVCVRMHIWPTAVNAMLFVSYVYIDTCCHCILDAKASGNGQKTFHNRDLIKPPLTHICSIQHGKKSLCHHPASNSGGGRRDSLLFHMQMSPPDPSNSNSGRTMVGG